MKVRIHKLIIIMTLIFGFSLGFAEDNPPVSELTTSVSAMRRIDPTKLSNQQRKEKADELEKAWETIEAAGHMGAAALKNELDKIDSQAEQDDLFKLGAAALLWKIGHINEVETIAKLWSDVGDLSINYKYVFFTAFEAAKSQDPRIIPMLLPILKDKLGSVFIPDHFMIIEHPLSHEFIWGAFGSKGLHHLEKVLKESKDETAIASAIRLLSRAQHINALENIRSIAHNKNSGITRNAAIKALGLYGHPQDFIFLVNGLKSSNPTELHTFAYSLYEYGDIRATPQLIRLLSTTDKELAKEIISFLYAYAAPDGLDALQRCAATSKTDEIKSTCADISEKIFESINTPSGAYNRKTQKDKEKLLSHLREQRNKKYQILPGDRRLTHDDLLNAAAEWKLNHRITDGIYEWVEDRHVMTAATAVDIPLLIDVSAACYWRLSDESLYEVRILQDLIQRLGRKRYRR